MFQTIEDAIQYIESKRNKRTIEEFKETLLKLGIPLKQTHMIHVGGTNGKGSTVNYLRSILQSHGYHVGTFTSPYIMKHNDRIRIDDEPISDDDLLKFINKYYDVIEENNMSMFEIDVLIMLDYFSTSSIDYRIIECGIGGLHDKTNVIEPEVSVITNIGRDHEELIGPSLYDIINEKMGIIKEGQIFVTSEKSGTVLARLQEQCDSVGALMVVVPEYETDDYPYNFTYRGIKYHLKDQGKYQVTNARLALTIAYKLITPNTTHLLHAIENASWAGRFELFQYKNHKIILDGAHNVPAIEALLETLQSYKEKKCIIFSSLKEKNVEEMLRKLSMYPLYLTTFPDERAIIFDKKVYKDAIVTKSFDEALKTAMISYDMIIVTGSLHFITYARKYLLKNSYES